MEGYIYLGEHYDVLNREIGISDKKIGLSINPIGREQSLTKTKSPIFFTDETPLRICSRFKLMLLVM